MNKISPKITLQPRILRIKEARAYLGMSERVFNRQVRPHLIELKIGNQGVGFDRLDLDNWIAHYKQRSQCAVLPEACLLTERTE